VGWKNNQEENKINMGKALQHATRQENIMLLLFPHHRNFIREV
jgi:hypothetical protein